MVTISILLTLTIVEDNLDSVKVACKVVLLSALHTRNTVQKGFTPPKSLLFKVQVAGIKYKK